MPSMLLFPVDRDTHEMFCRLQSNVAAASLFQTNQTQSRIQTQSHQVSFRKHDFFLAPRYISIGLFQHSLFLIFLCHYRTGKYVVIVCFFLFFSPIPYLCPTMLNHTNIRAIFSSQLQSFYFITLLFFNRSTGDN